MKSLKTVCLLYFALLVVLTKESISPEDNGTNAQAANNTATNDKNAQDRNNTAPNDKNAQDRNNTAPNGKNAQDKKNTALNNTTNAIERKKNQTTLHFHTEHTSSSASSSPKSTGQPPVCPAATTKPSVYQCIFSLPSGDKLHLIVAVLIVGCLVLLMTTLMCACQVCHLKGLISGLHSRHDNIDLRAIREKTETPQKNTERVDRHPAETCLLLSEVTTGQEQSKELEVKIEEVKVEEMEQTGTEMPVMDPNGDVNQENSIVPIEKQPESSDKSEV